MISIDKHKCVGCGQCAKDCVTNNIELTGGKAAARGACMLCGHCVAICPQGCVSIDDYPMYEVKDYQKETFSIHAEHFLNAVKFRRSVRQFSQKPLEKEKLLRVLEAGRYTETAVNRQGTRFILVQEQLAAFKTLVWEGWRRFALELKKKDAFRADLFMSYYRAWKSNPLEDRLFFQAPALLVVASDTPLDGGLASANIETMAVAEGLGVMFDGYIAYAIEHSPQAAEWLEIGQKKIASCMLLGYPNVRYLRTAPRKPADIIWK